MKTPPFLLTIIFFLLVLTASSSLMAQQVHLGTKSQYPIGNNDIPSKVFLFFLQEKSIQGYEDSSLMTSPNNWLGNSKASIEYTGKAPNFIYSIVAGHEEDIIDGVNDAAIQKQFNEWYANWMNNPTRQEICDYFRCKVLAYFWAHDGQKITPTPTIYFDSQAHNITAQHQFLVPKDNPSPNHDYAITGADAISQYYEDAANKIAAQYPHATSWQASKHACPVFMNGRVRLWQVQIAPSNNIFGLLNNLLEEKHSSSLPMTKEDVAQQQDTMDLSPFNPTTPIPTSFMATLCYETAILGKFQDGSKNINNISTPSPSQDDPKKGENNSTKEDRKIQDDSKNISNISSPLPSQNDPQKKDENSTKKEEPSLQDILKTLENHDQFGSFFVNKIIPNFIVPPIIGFIATKEYYSQSAWNYTVVNNNIDDTALLLDPRTGWCRDAYGWDFFGIKYDALDF